MRYLIFIILTVVAYCCKAADYGLKSSPVVVSWSALSSTVTLPLGVRYRWIATNLFDPVTNWTDIVSGSVWTQTTAAQRPRWTNGYGVYFNGSQYLEDNHSLLNKSNGILTVLKFENITAASCAWNYQNNVPTFVGAVNGTWKNTSFTFGSVQSNLVYDYFVSPNVASAGLGDGIIYTNGVSSTKSFTHWGALNNVIYWIGQGGSGSWFKGQLYELVVWSNAVAFTSTDMQQIHNYVKQTYGVSP